MVTAFEQNIRQCDDCMWTKKRTKQSSRQIIIHTTQLHSPCIRPDPDVSSFLRNNDGFDF